MKDSLYVIGAICQLFDSLNSWMLGAVYKIIRYSYEINYINMNICTNNAHAMMNCIDLILLATKQGVLKSIEYIILEDQRLTTNVDNY